MASSLGKLGAWQANQTGRPSGSPGSAGGVRAGLSRPRGGSGERRDRPAHGTDERRLRPGLGWARERSRSRSRSSGKHPGSGGGIPHPGAGLCTRGDPRAAAGGCAHSPRPGSIPGLGRPVDPGAELGDPRGALPGRHRRPGGPRGSQGSPLPRGSGHSSADAGAARGSPRSPQIPEDL